MITGAQSVRPCRPVNTVNSVHFDLGEVVLLPGQKISLSESERNSRGQTRALSVAPTVPRLREQALANRGFDRWLVLHVEDFYEADSGRAALAAHDSGVGPGLEVSQDDR